MSYDFEAEVKKALKDFGRDTIDAMEDTIDKIAKEAVQRLKDASPGSGKYAASWSKRAERGRIGTKTVTIYNRRYGWRTHLLENGHVTRNKKGAWGRTPAVPHIAPVEEWVVDETPKEFEKELNK